jgi:type I restriction enzyme S subunit
MKPGWQKKTLAEVCQIRPPKSEAREKLAQDAMVSFAPMEDLGIDRKFLNPTQQKPLASVAGSYTYFADGDVLLAKITPCFENGKLGIAKDLNNGIGFGSSEFVVFRPCDDLDCEFLYYYLSRDDFRREGAGRMGGAVGQQRVPKEFVESYPIPLPPLNEQQRIVGILDEAFECIATAKANAEKNLQNARNIFESHLHSVFAQRGNEWVDKRLGDVVTRLTNGYVGPTRNIYIESGVPYLLARHVKNNRLAFDGKTFISAEFNRKNKKSMLKAGDVLLVQSGHIGHSAVVTEEHEGHNCHAMIVISPVRDVVTGPFLSLYFNSPEMRQRFEEIRSGSTVPHLTCRAVKELTISLPDLPVQQRLVDHSQEMQAETQRLETIYQRKLDALEALKKSLLHQAFTGEL